MNLAQILNLVIQWGGRIDLEEAKFKILKVTNDNIVIEMKR